MDSSLESTVGHAYKAVRIKGGHAYKAVKVLERIPFLLSMTKKSKIIRRDSLLTGTVIRRVKFY